MRDPLPAPLGIVRLATPFAQQLSLRTLSLHVHEVLPTFAFYNFINLYLSGHISRRLCARTYNTLSERSRTNWDAHVVSLVQSSLINTLALWVIYTDRERWAMSPGERVWGYTGSMGLVQACSAGYFLWDLIAASSRPDVHGEGAIAHAACALAVSMLGFVGSSQCRVASADRFLATILQLLWHQLCPLRAIYTLPELPLVYGQAGHDWIKPAIDEWHRTHCQFWRQ